LLIGWVVPLDHFAARLNRANLIADFDAKHFKNSVS